MAFISHATEYGRLADSHGVTRSWIKSHQRRCRWPVVDDTNSKNSLEFAFDETSGLVACSDGLIMCPCGKRSQGVRAGDYRVIKFKGPIYTSSRHRVHNLIFRALKPQLYKAGHPITHKDGNKSNNSIGNLEIDKGRSNVGTPNTTEVTINIGGTARHDFPSVKEAADFIRCNPSSVSNALGAHKVYGWTVDYKNPNFFWTTSSRDGYGKPLPFHTRFPNIRFWSEGFFCTRYHQNMLPRRGYLRNGVYYPNKRSKTSVAMIIDDILKETRAN